MAGYFFDPLRPSSATGGLRGQVNFLGKLKRFASREHYRAGQQLPRGELLEMPKKSQNPLRGVQQRLRRGQAQH